VLLAKPVLLWFLISKDLKEYANAISLYYLVIASVTVVLNNEAHFYFYKEIFSTGTSSTAVYRRFKQYIDNLYNHLLLFLPLVVLIIHFLVEDWRTTFLFSVMVVLEKLYDEVQRFFQFRQEFVKWCIISLVKNVFPVALLVSVISHGIIFPESYFYICLAMCIIISLLINPILSLKQIRFGIKSSIKFKSYLLYYLSKLLPNQLQSISSRNLPLIDRYFIQFKFPELLAEYSLITQFSSAFILIVDSFIISHRKNKYVDKTLKVNEIEKFQVLFIFWLLVLAIFELAAYYGFQLNWFRVISFEMEVVYIAILYFSIFAMSQHFSIYCFWHKPRKFTLLIDSSVFVSCVILYFFSKGFGFEIKLLSLIFFLTIAQALRFFVLYRLSLSKSY
jgi:hypothetical protein